MRRLDYLPRRGWSAGSGAELEQPRRRAREPAVGARRLATLNSILTIQHRSDGFNRPRVDGVSFTVHPRTINETPSTPCPAPPAAITLCSPPPRAFTASAQEVEVLGRRAHLADRCTPTPMSGEAERASSSRCSTGMPGRPAGGPPSHTGGVHRYGWTPTPRGRPVRRLSVSARQFLVPSRSGDRTVAPPARRDGPLPRLRSPRRPPWSALHRGEDGHGRGRAPGTRASTYRLRRPAARQTPGRAFPVPKRSSARQAGASAAHREASQASKRECERDA